MTKKRNPDWILICAEIRKEKPSSEEKIFFIFSHVGAREQKETPPAEEPKCPLLGSTLPPTWGILVPTRRLFIFS